MGNAAGLVIGLVVCFGAVLLFVGIFAVVFFLLARNVGAMGANLQALVEEWAERHGYELLELGDTASGNHPFKDRFGFGFGKKAAICREVEMRDRDGRTRLGWVYVRARIYGGGFVRDSVEVAWDD